jgi:hypothetical protein
MVFNRRPVALSQIQFFDWERLADHRSQTVETSTIALALACAARSS